MRVLLVMGALALAACSPQIIDRTIYVEVAEEAPVVEQPVAPEEPAPVWVPEVWHIYVLDSAAVIQYEETAMPAGLYQSRLTCWRLQVEVENAAHPEDMWTVVGGGVE